MASKGRTCVLGFLVAVGASLDAVSSSGADNPLNSSEYQGADSAAARPVGGRNDFTIVPVAGGTTDIRIGGGFFAGLTRNQAGYTPFAWNLEGGGFVSFLVKDGKAVLPYTDVYSTLTVRGSSGVRFSSKYARRSRTS